MIKSRLIELFNAFSKKEIKPLGKFIASPFFNQRGHVIQLFDYLVMCKFEKNRTPLRKEAFQKLFPDQPFDDHKLRLSMSLLHKVFEKYLIWQQINKEETSAKIKLATAYRELNLSRHFIKTSSEIKTLQNNQPFRNADFYQNQYEVYLEEYLFFSENSRMENINLQSVQQNMDIAFMTSKLRQSCFLLSHQNIYKKEYDFGMLQQMLHHIEQTDHLDTPAISVYYYCYHALVQPTEYVYFEKFKALVFQYQSHFPKREIRDLFLLATNYCIRLMNQGERRFAKEGLTIFKEGLKNEALLINGTLSHFTYRNIVAMAIISKDYDWVEGFIQDYKIRLTKNHRENMFSFNLAWLEYERKNYDKALDLLNRSTFSDLLLNLSAKTIAMKIYYELDAFNLLYSHLEAMKKFISRKELIAYHKKNYLNTIKFTKKLLELPISNREVREKLRSEIETTALVAEKRWLLSQLG